MTAFARLWRRAPGWRLCLVAALATTALAAMFPPHVPDLSAVLRPHPAAAAASYRPAAASTAAIGGTATLKPPLGAGLSGSMAFAGHRLPLPPGNWQVLALGRSDRPQPVQVAVLARFATPGSTAGVTGLIEAVAPTALADGGGPVGLPEACQRQDTLAQAITLPTAATRSPQDHECWTLTDVPTGGDQLRGSHDAVLQAAFGRLDRLHAVLPPRLLCLWYFRSDPASLLDVTQFLPPPALSPRHGTAHATPASLPGWAATAAAALHAGYDGRATTAPDPPG